MKFLYFFNNYAPLLYVVLTLAIINVLVVIIRNLSEISKTLTKINIETNIISQKVISISIKQTKINNSFSRALELSIKTFAEYKIIQFIFNHIFKNKQKKKSNKIFKTKDRIKKIFAQGKAIKKLVDVFNDIKKFIS